jgi:hypothetical protein
MKMGWFGFGKKEEIQKINKNRCCGCEHYDGFRDNKFVRCGLKHKATIDAGCSSFTPDVTAGCWDCVYRDRSKERYFCSIHNVRYEDEVKYCHDFAETWNT